ncbi:MAG: hypothetical protein COB67_03180, partial [SAR324 cluster bacterium]
PARNYWRTDNGRDIQERQAAYVFNPSEIWDGLVLQDEKKQLCNGLIADWASWQKENSTPFQYLCSILEALSPSAEEPIKPGPLKRISLDDARDIPTLSMPYGQDIPVMHAASGIRKIIALAYLLVWSLEEHRKACELTGEEEVQQVIFLIDEVESHLHPRWQQTIIPSLLNIMNNLESTAAIQLIATTHSPLVMASLEQTFDHTKDAWFDLDLGQENKSEVTVIKKDFSPQGDAAQWLTSDAFDLTTARDIEINKLIHKASRLLDESSFPSQGEVSAMYQELIHHLNVKDKYLFRWRWIAEKKGFTL